VDVVFYHITVVLYFLGTICELINIALLKSVFYKYGKRVLGLGFVFHTLALLIRALEMGHVPITNLFESLSFFAWVILLFYGVIHHSYKIKVLGAFVAPVVLIIVVISLRLPKEIFPVHPILKSYWLPIHVAFAFLGNAAFCLAFCSGIMYLIQENQLKFKRFGFFFKRLPSLQILDELNYRSLTLGFPFQTVGIITGSIWANFAWGSFWSWDPKETWSLITWLFYLALLHQRLAIGWRGKKAAVMAIVGFIIVLFTFLGVNLLPGGLHSYGKWK
jgi:cytochrome c-type biogenesis protein CcsB